MLHAENNEAPSDCRYRDPNRCQSLSGSGQINLEVYSLRDGKRDQNGNGEPVEKR